MTDTEDFLRAGMARFTEDVSVPSGLPARASRHLRRRKAAIAASVTATLAAVTATALALTSASAGPGQVTGVQPAAYVITRAEAALTAVSQQDFIQAITVTANHGSGATSVWTYRELERLTVDELDGRPGYDAGYYVAGNHETIIVVNYETRTWYRYTIALEPVTAHPVTTPTSVPTCDPALTEDIYTPPVDDWAAVFRDALNCGLYQVAGTELVNGERLYKLTPVHPARESTGDVIQTVYWIDASTYLPVRAELTVANIVDLETFRWLPPTAANLKNFTVPIPARLTRVPPPAGS